MPTIADATFDRAVDCLHAAAAGRETWVAASRLACDVVGADAAALVVWRAGDGTVDLIEGYGHDPALVRDYSNYYYQHDVLMKFARFSNEWQVSDELYPASQWGRSEFFGECLHKHRVAQVLALTLRLGTDVKVALSFHRHTRQDTRAADFHQGSLRCFTEHAFRAFTTREAMIQGARTSLAEALTSADSVCFLANAKGRMTPLSTPLAIGRLLASGKLFVDGHSIRHREGRFNARLLRLIAAAAGGRRGRVCLSGGFCVALRVEAQPAPSATKLATTEALALVRVMVLDPATPPDEEDLRGLFGLTFAQARVLVLLCQGQSVAECAGQLHCAEATIRTHVAHLMSKMNCRRQGQLIRAAMMAV